MTATATEAEVTAVHAPGAGMATYSAPQVEEYRARILMQPEEARALAVSLENNMRAVLKEDIDFGVIPGTGTKPSLLKPGAEKLLQWFGFGHVNERDEIERDSDGGRIGVTYRCRVTKAMPDGRTVTVATCEGYAGYDEDRFFATEEDARAKAEARERANAAKYHRDANPAKWLYLTAYKAPWNSVIKMAQKRAMVGAALAATSASTLFTQDVEDMQPAAVPAAEDEGAKFRTAATNAVMALDQPVRDAVDRWYRGKKWPGPQDWTPEQWCTALQAAGFITGQRSQQQAAPAQPAAAAAAASEYEQALSHLDPNDPWTERVKDIGDEGEARRVLADLAGSGVPVAKGHRIRVAVLVRFPAAADAESEAE